MDTLSHLKYKKAIFGGHFYPCHITFWLTNIVYNTYRCVYIYNPTEIFIGFILISSLWSFIEYIFHRVLLHTLFYAYHKIHHVYPNKLSIIHTPMSIVLLSYLSCILIFYNLTYFSYMFQMYIGINYLLFEYTHLISHTYRGSNSIIMNTKLYHKLHHIDESVNYSFVTPFWDYLFGTLSSKYSVSFIELLFGFIPFYSFLIHRPQHID